MDHTFIKTEHDRGLADQAGTENCCHQNTRRKKMVRSVGQAIGNIPAIYPVGYHSLFLNLSREYGSSWCLMASWYCHFP